MDLAISCTKQAKPFQVFSILIPCLFGICFYGDLVAQINVKLDQSFEVGDTIVEIYKVVLEAEMGNTTIRTLHHYSDGSIYLLSRSGLFHWRSDSAYLVQQSSRLNTQDINYSAEDREGRIWFYSEWFKMNAPITNLISYKPNSDEPFKNPLLSILDKGEAITKLAELNTNVIAFQTNRNRLLIYEKSDTYRLIPIDDGFQLLGSSGKQLIFGRSSDQSIKISLLNFKTGVWEHLPTIKENWRIDHCTIQNGGLICVGVRPSFNISIFDRENRTWNYQEAPADLFHYFYSCGTIQIQNLEVQDFFTLDMAGLKKSRIKNSINSALQHPYPKFYYFYRGQNWVLVKGSLYLIRIRRNKDFLTALNDLPNHRISTRGLFLRDNQTILAGLMQDFLK
ncbi:MAG: hypothetical protein EA409_01900 [Saprospirales bacterium]|nr:MAG: hypothetical protein EA409_01900 [Saprospirales bacterium]